MRIIYSVLLALIYSNCMAETYYVSTTGSDSNNGLSVDTPFLTITKAVQLSALAPGDTIRVLAGEYKSIRISITKDGTEASPITLMAHGDGEVKLNFGYQPSTGWALHSGNVYKITVPITTYYVYNVVIDNDPKYRRKASLGAVVAPYDFYQDQATDVLYVYPSNGSDPTGKESVFIGSNEYWYGLFFNLANHWVVDGLTIVGSEGHAITIDADNVTVKNCTMRWNAKNAVYYWSSLGAGTRHDKAMVDNVLSEWNMMRNWPRCSPGFTSGLWGQGISITNTNNATVKNSTVRNGGGEGIGFVKVNPGLMENNDSYNNWSVGLYSDESQNITIRNNDVYVSSDHVNVSDIDGALSDQTTIDRCVQRLRQEGVTVGDEYYSDTSSATSTDVQIYNNVISNTSYGFNYITENVTSPGMKNITFSNNTVVLPDSTGPRGDYSAINIRDYEGNINTVFKNNIFYASYATSSLIYTGYGLTTEPRNVSMTNNVWYHSGRNDPFYYTGEYRTYSNFSSSYPDQATSSLYVDPSFLAQETSDYHLSSTSQAIGHGTATTPLTDKDGVAWSSPPSAGAYEYTDGSTPSPSGTRYRYKAIASQE